MRKPAVFFLACFAVMASARPQAFKGTVDYDKKKHACIIAEYSFVPQATEGAFLQKMEKLGFRSREEKGLFNKDKGFRVFKSAIVADISSSSMDYIVKVERKSRREKEESVLFLVILKSGNNVVAAGDHEVINNARAFLDNLLPDVEAFNLELQIKDKEDEVVKTEKKLKGLQDDRESLEKKIRNLQDDLIKNEKDQEKTRNEIETLKKALESLKSNRKIPEKLL
jgi:hypothetical protein